jgi:hypothetical protein
VADATSSDMTRRDRPARRSRPWLWALFLGLLEFDFLACWLLLWQHDTTAGLVCLGVSVIFALGALWCFRRALRRMLNDDT